MIGRYDRRSILKSGIAAGVGLAAGGLARPSLAQDATELSFAVWGSDAEIAAYGQVIEKYQATKSGVRIRLDVQPFAQFYQQLDTRLAGRQAPDIFRVTYQQVGRYAMAEAAVDLSDYIESNAGEAFTPSVWKAVNYEETPYALPHHTDTFALFYNKDLLDKAGASLPASLDQAWTWAQFGDTAKRLKEQSAGSFPFAMAWQNAAVHRWMIYLYQHGGKLVGDDLQSSAINSPAGIETIAWNQSWFKDGLVPPSTSLKSSEKVQNLFANGTIAMMLNGNWQIPFLEKQATKFQWGVTYLPRDVAAADDLGGTCVAVSRDCDEPEAAADFLKFLTDEANMRDFVNAAQFLPVRKSLVDGGVQYALRPEEMKVFVEQTKTVPEHMVSTVIMPTWGKFNPRLADELDLAFTSGQSPEETAANIEGYVNDILLAS